MRSYLGIITVILFMASCHKPSYNDPPFGGMKGRVLEVTTFHIMPEDWRMGNRNDWTMYINASAFDFQGNEICSALLDSLGRTQSLAESMFENRVCVHSTQKAGTRTVAEISLKSVKGKTLTYEKTEGGRKTVMVVKKRDRHNVHKSTVYENGAVTMTNIIKTDRSGLPLSVRTIDPGGNGQLQTNVYNSYGDITEKRIKTTADDKESITYTEYLEYDSIGNWIEARTYNKIHMAEEILRRKITYWP